MTKDKIKEEIQLKNIIMDPFEPRLLNPNSYNYRLGNLIKVYNKESGEDIEFDDFEIPESGFLLKPKQMYLAATYETIGSCKFAMSLIGRSSLGRLGLFLQCSANLGHTGVAHKWTLELVAAKPILVYPSMPIGQVSFWVNLAQPISYNGYYGQFNVPMSAERKLTKSGLFHEEVVQRKLLG